MPEYEVVNGLGSDSKYSELSNIDGELTSQQESLLLSALKEGKIFLEISGEIALYILRNVPGALNYIKARYTRIFMDEYQDCGEIRAIVRCCPENVS